MRAGNKATTKEVFMVLGCGNKRKRLSSGTHLLAQRRIAVPHRSKNNRSLWLSAQAGGLFVYCKKFNNFTCQSKNIMIY